MFPYFSYLHSLFTVAFGNSLAPPAEVMLREHQHQLKVYDSSICFRASLKETTFQGLACEFRISAAVGSRSVTPQKKSFRTVEKKEYLFLKETGEAKDLCVHFTSEELLGGQVVDLASIDTGCVTVSQRLSVFPRDTIQWK